MTRRWTSRSRLCHVAHVVLVCLFLSLLTARTSLASTTSTSRTAEILSSRPLSFTQSIVDATSGGGGGGTQFINKFFQSRWNKAVALAQLEQSVEDYNAAWIASHADNKVQAIAHRRLIALPLDYTENDLFDPPMGVFSHGHTQTGDKMSLPKNFWQAIQQSKAEVPWLFSVSRIDDETTGPRVELATEDSSNSDSGEKEKKSKEQQQEEELAEYRPMKPLDKVVGGPLDFRAPSNYVFLPLWMMRALGLRPRDVVCVELIQTVPAGSLAKLRPRRKEFAKRIANPQSVLETELRHYSALTQGSTIALDYNGQRYWLDVVELRSANRGEKQEWIKTQDCDIATDFLPSKENMLEAKRKKLQRQQERREQQQENQ